MDDSEANLSSDGSKMTPSSEKPKPKKRSLVERELETSLTARVTSPALCGEGANTSRYGRARRVKTDADFCNTEKAVTIALKSPKYDKTPIKSPTAYKMHASNSPVRVESVLQNQIENICTANIALSRFGSDEKSGKSPSPAAKKFPKTYVKTDLIQTKEKEETITLIKNMFSPNKSGYKPNRHMSNLDRSSEKCVLNGNMPKQQNGYAEKASIVKTLDFDSKQKSKTADVSIIKSLNFDTRSRRKDREPTTVLSKSELFDLEAKCEYQVGDLAWARMGTYPFWPCIVTREPDTNMFVRIKLFGRIERNIINVTFFGDNGRRSWIVDTMLRKFQGLKEFEATREQFKPEDKKKDPRLYAAFFISDKKQALWLKSVEEAETFMKEPKRLRIDLLYDLLEKSKIKQNQKSQKKVSRADSDVSLSESLLDTLFSEDDSKSDDPDRSRKNRMSLDVSEVVTACLDNMAARTGLTQIQKQSHMDRWLQKAKSKTPEKSQLEITITVEKVDEAKEKTKVNEKRISKYEDKNKSKKKILSNTVTQKPYSLRKSTGESHLLPIHNEHDYSAKFNVDNCYVKLENIPLNNTVVKSTSSSDSTETIGKINNSEKELQSLSNGVMDDQIETEILNAVDTKEDLVIEPENNVTDDANVSPLEKKFESSLNDTKLTQGVLDVTSEKTGEENERNSLINEILNHQIALEINKIVSLEENVPGNNEISDEHGSCTEMDVDPSFNEQECTPGIDVDNKCVKNTVSSEQVTDIITIESCIEIAAIKSVEDDTDSKKNIDKNDIHSEADDIPTISVDQAQPNINENICEYTLVEKNARQDLTQNEDHEMSCNDEGIDSSTKMPPVNKKQVINMLIQDVDKKKESVDRKKNRNKISSEKETESKQAVPLKIEDNMTIKDSVQSLSSVLEKSNDNDSKIAKNDIHNEPDDIPTISMDQTEPIINKPIKNICEYPLAEKNGKQDLTQNEDHEMSCDDEGIVSSTKMPPVNNKQVNNLLTQDTDKKKESVYRKRNRNKISSKKETGSKQVETLKIDENITVKDSVQSLSSDLEKSNDNDSKIAKNDIHNEVNDIPTISMDQTEPIINENICEYPLGEKNCKQDLTQNEDHEMSCDNESLDCSTEMPAVNNEPVISLLIQEADKEKKSVDRKRNRNKISSEKVTKSKLAETLKIDENMTTKDSVHSLSSDLAKVNDIKCSIGEPFHKTKDLAEQDVLCDADFTTMLSERIVTQKHKNESEEKTQVTLQYINKSSRDNNNKKTLKIKDIYETKIKSNDFKPEINKNSESDIKTDLTPKSMKNIMDSKINNDFSSKSLKNLNSEIKYNSVECETTSQNSISKIKVNDTEKEQKNENVKNELTQKHLKCEIKTNCIDSEKQMTESAKKGPSSGSFENCSVVVVPLNGPTLNGYYENKLKDTKEDGSTDSDTASTNSELDDLSLIELKKRTIAKTRARRNLTLNKQKSNESLVEMREINSQSPLPKIVQMSSGEIKINGNTEASVEKDETVVTKRILRPRNDTPVESLNASKESSPDRKIKEEIDFETASITSEGSNISTKRRGRPKDKASDEDKMKDPEFVRYLELRQDTLIDEHPELKYDEIVAYLYKTWLYEQSNKSDFVKSHDKEQSNLVKGINPNAPQVKTKKRSKPDKNKLISIDKVFNKELVEEFSYIPAKDKPKRKTSQPCYAEDYSDIEDEIKMFEIFNNRKEKPKTSEITEQKDVPSSSGIKKEIVETVEVKEELSPEEYYDEVEAYFEDLTKPKPNVFKGLVREKVCEICEKTSNLVKCKGCNGMFHIECVKKEVDIVDVPVSTRVRRKKKKPRGRRPKSSTDSNGLDESHSDEKSQDASVSEENKSVEEILDESHIVVADVDNFEAQVAAKMKEMIEVDDKIDYDSYSSDDCLDWHHTIAGKCEIVDVKLKPKKPEIDNTNFKCNNCQKDDVPLCFVCKSPVSPKSQNNHRQKCQVAHCHKFYHLECLEYWPQTQFNTVDSSRSKGNVNEHSEALTCPRHVCHTCVCDDPRGCKTRFSGDKLARCVRCPATYHSFTKCLPAGSQILTASHIICPRHYEHRPGKVPCHVNTGWCFICAQGGTLICCEYCPTSFHAECLQIDPPDGGYMCEDCETGRLPLYGEMVWVKLGHYRWWPGIVLHPYQIPSNIMAVRHSPGEFVVRFFGQYDHYWVNRGRVFPYQEGDSGRISSQKSKIDEAFTVAMEHAQRAYDILKTLEEDEESPDIASSLLPPHYVKLKSNKPHAGCGAGGARRELEESSLTQCDCDPNEEFPCGPASHCLNRMLLTECGPSCRAGDRCNNRAFERREYPRLTAYRTKHRGWGLKALEDIKAGQFVIEYVGELIDEEEFRRRMRRKHEIRDENFYFLTLDKERMIDAGPKGNLARFMNHCCEPNCETQKWTVLGDVRVGLFALKDIPANSELTFNYNLECAGIEKKRCMCGAKRCSGYIGAKPKQEEKESQKKPKVPTTKRPYKKRKPEDIANEKNKPKRPVGRPPKPRELTEIEKDLLIIKNATNGISSDSECSGRLSSVDAESERKDMKALKRKRVSFSSEEVDSKRVKYDEDKTSSEID